MHSCAYEGTVTHCRREPVAHRFQYRLFMVWLDLDELPALVERGGLLAPGRWGATSFLRSDHLFGAAESLDAEVRSIIRRQTGQVAGGPIRLLTQLRCWGYYFSPLNLFYVYSRDESCVEYVVAEVNNTPWGERHCYVLWKENRCGAGGELSFSHDKEFHVSPFMGMEMEYRWRLGNPGERLAARIDNFQDGRALFNASLELKRRELTRAQLRRLMVRYPLMTAQISAAIYFQALRLWWKQCPLYAHPKKQAPVPSSRPMNPSTADSYNAASWPLADENRSLSNPRSAAPCCGSSLESTPAD